MYVIRTSNRRENLKSGRFYRSGPLTKFGTPVATLTRNGRVIGKTEGQLKGNNEQGEGFGALIGRRFEQGGEALGVDVYVFGKRSDSV